jgi:hypothetical protein
VEIVIIEDSPDLLAISPRLNYRVKAVFDRREAGILGTSCRAKLEKLKAESNPGLPRRSFFAKAGTLNREP